MPALLEDGKRKEHPESAQRVCQAVSPPAVALPGLWDLLPPGIPLSSSCSTRGAPSQFLHLCPRCLGFCQLLPGPNPQQLPDLSSTLGPWSTIQNLIYYSAHSLQLRYQLQEYLGSIAHTTSAKYMGFLPGPSVDPTLLSISTLHSSPNSPTQIKCHFLGEVLPVPLDSKYKEIRYALRRTYYKME